jgi:hypothetical protein
LAFKLSIQDSHHRLPLLVSESQKANGFLASVGANPSWTIPMISDCPSTRSLMHAQEMVLWLALVPGSASSVPSIGRVLRNGAVPDSSKLSIPQGK